MNKTKCSRCDLVNLASDHICRRCGNDIAQRARDNYAARSPREAAKRSSSIYTILVLGALGAGAAYLFTGFEKSMGDVRSAEVNRVAVQAKQPDGLSTRNEVDQKRAGQYGNAIHNAPALAVSDKHNEEIKKLMENGQANTHR